MKEKGQGVIIVAGMALIMLAIGGLSIDSGVYFAIHRGMQNAADAAALASAAELFKNDNDDTALRLQASRDVAVQYASENMNNQLDSANDVEFGYVDPVTGSYDATTFTAPNAGFSDTGGYNAVRVNVRRGASEANPEIPAIFTRMLGFTGYDSDAEAVAIYGGSIGSYTGLRPVYLCQTAWDQAVAMYGDPRIPEITFYNDNLIVGTTALSPEQSCGTMAPGNFGLSDFTNSGSPGAAQVRSWFENGYPGKVKASEAYQPQTGTSLNSYVSELTNLKNQGTVIAVPLYTKSTGVGTNVKYDVSAFAAFVITDFKTTGSNKYITGHFEKMICNKNCTLATAPTGGSSITKLRLVH